jgi:hypothetical protein
MAASVGKIKIGGPLRRDRSFLFSNFEQTRLHNAVVLTLLPANVAAINHTPDQLGAAASRLASGLVPTGYNTTNFLARVDHRFNEANLLMARYSFYDLSSRNARSVGGLNFTSRGTALENRDQTIALSEVATLSARTANEARFQFTRSRLAAPPNDLTSPAINISGVANFGTATFSPTGRDIDSYGSALPFNIQTGTDRNNDTNTNDRPAGVGRNTGVGFDFASFDLRLSRRVHLSEQFDLEVIAEGFNLFNQANLQLPNNIFGAGATPLPSFRKPTAAADPRQLQFGLRLSF